MMLLVKKFGVAGYTNIGSEEYQRFKQQLGIKIIFYL